MTPTPDNSSEAKGAVKVASNITAKDRAEWLANIENSIRRGKCYPPDNDALVDGWEAHDKVGFVCAFITKQAAINFAIRTGRGTKARKTS